jgi:hypothetical protein
MSESVHLVNEQGPLYKTDAATFYAVGNARYFPGAVALLNSLRLTGHAEQLVFGDCGFTPAQRTQLSPHCTLFEIPGNIATQAPSLRRFPTC